MQPQVTSHEELYDLKWREIERLGVAGFVTETGDCCLELADSGLARWGYSWHHWAYKLYGDWTWDSHGLFSLGDDDNYSCPTLESCLDTERASLFARTYPAAVAGTTDYFSFDPETSEAVLCYILSISSLYLVYIYSISTAGAGVHARGWPGLGGHCAEGAGDLALRWRPHRGRVAARPRLLELHGRVLRRERGGGRHQPRDLAGGRLAGGAALRGHHTNPIVQTIV